MSLLQKAYKNGFERKQFDAFGVILQPITLGHIQLLAELNSSIPYPGQPVEKDDIGMAVAIGAYPLWEQSREQLRDDSYMREIVKRIVSTSDTDEQIANALNWIVYYLAKPRHNGLSDPMSARCPWWWTYAEFLQTEMGRSESEAWDTICCDAFAYYAAYATRNGSEQFMSIREVWFAEQFEKGKTVKDLFNEGSI